MRAIRVVSLSGWRLGRCREVNELSPELTFFFLWLDGGDLGGLYMYV